MKSNILLSSILFFLFVLTFSSCSDDDTVESLSGTYVLNKFELKGCQDSGFNQELSATNEGFCFEEDGEMACFDVSFTFTATTYTVVITISADGFTISENDMGTYDPNSATSEICLDGECDVVTVSDDGDKFTFEVFDEDVGCTISIEMVRE